MPDQHKLDKAGFHAFLEHVLDMMRPSTLAAVINDIDELQELAPLGRTSDAWRAAVERHLHALCGKAEADQYIRDEAARWEPEQ